MSKELQIKQENTVMELFKSEYVTKAIAQVLPSIMSADQLIRISLSVIRTNPKLLECSQQSLLSCLMGCASLGLSPEPFLGQAYLVPFHNSTLNCKEATLIIGFKGLLTLLRRSGELSSISVQAVYVNDNFTMKWGLEETLDHTPAEGERGDFKGAWVVFKYKDGGHSMEYMPKFDIDKIRATSKTGKFGPWKDHYAEMAKKTVIRRHMKTAPLSTEDNRIQKAVQYENLQIADIQSSFFLPETTEKAPVIEQTQQTEQKGGSSFETMFKTYIADPLFADWLDICAKANKTTVDGVKIFVMKKENTAGFLAGFGTWKAKQTATTQTTGAATQKTTTTTNAETFLSEEDIAFKNKWFRKGSKFPAYYLENIDEFTKYSAAIQEQARDKFKRAAGCYPEDYVEAGQNSATDQTTAGSSDSTGEVNTEPSTEEPIENSGSQEHDVTIIDSQIDGNTASGPDNWDGESTLFANDIDGEQINTQTASNTAEQTTTKTADELLKTTSEYKQVMLIKDRDFVAFANFLNGREIKTVEDCRFIINAMTKDD